MRILSLRADLTLLNEDLMVGAAYDEVRKTLIIFSGGRCIVPTGYIQVFLLGMKYKLGPEVG